MFRSTSAKKGAQTAGTRCEQGISGARHERKNKTEKCREKFIRMTENAESVSLANGEGYDIMGVVWYGKERSNMGTFIVGLVFAAFVFFILTAGYNEDKTWNL